MKTNERSRQMDILKGIAILMIILTHYSFTDDQRHRMLFPFWIDQAVPVFMIVSGYVTTLAYKRRGIKTLREGYEPKYKIASMLRILLPFTYIFIVEIIVGFWKNGWSLRELPLFIPKLYVIGGLGPGAYYVPLMIGMILIFPLLYLIIERFGFAGLWMIAVLNIVYELCRIRTGIPDNIENCLIFRYMFVLSSGIWLASEKYVPHPLISAIGFIIGALFLYGVYYGGYQPVIFNQWSWSSAIACLYTIPIVGIVIKKGQGLHCGVLELLGKASFNIYLVQKVWYYMLITFYAQEGSGRFYILQRLALTYAVCIVIGLVFYKLESKSTKRIISAVHLQ